MTPAAELSVNPIRHVVGLAVAWLVLAASPAAAAETNVLTASGTRLSEQQPGGPWSAGALTDVEPNPVGRAVAAKQRYRERRAQPPH